MSPSLVQVIVALISGGVGGNIAGAILKNSVSGQSGKRLSGC